MRRFRKVTCALFGHARVYSAFFGYVSCGRCGEQIGDTLAGSFSDKGSVSCSCNGCRENWKELKFMERWLCKEPAWSGLSADDLRKENSRKLDAAIAEMRAETERLRAQRIEAT